MCVDTGTARIRRPGTWTLLPVLIAAALIGGKPALGQPTPGVSRGLQFSPDVSDAAFRPRQRFALCVGIDSYQEGSGYSPLKYAGRDAVGTAEVLLEACKFDRLLLLTDAEVPSALTKQYVEPHLRVIRDVSRNCIRDRAEEFFAQARNPDDVVVFYFAGHGDAKETAYLVARDYHHELASGNVLPLATVFQWVLSGPVRAQNRVFIFDACRASPAGRYAQGMAPGFHAALALPEHRMIVISGCGVGQSAYEDASLGHGRFSWALIEALKGNAYKAGEENLLVSHVYEYIDQTFTSQGWVRQQTPRWFTAVDHLFALAYRKVAKPQSFDSVEWEQMQKLHDEAARHYLRNDLERSDSTYRFCLRAMSSTPTQDSAARRLWGNLLAERSCVLYRLGRLDESSELAAKAKSLAPDDPSLRELEGYRLSAAGKLSEANEAYAQVISRSGDPDRVPPHVWSQRGLALFRLQQFREARESFENAATLSLKLGCLEDAASNLDRAGLCRSRTGDLKGAYEFVRKAYRLLLETRGDKRTPAQADLLEHVSVLLDWLGNPRDAEASALESLAIRSQVLGENHPDTAVSVRHLGNLYRKMGEFARAEPLLRRAMEIHLKVFGQEHPGTAASLVDLARLYDATENYSQAERLLTQAQEIERRLFVQSPRPSVAAPPLPLTPTQEYARQRLEDILPALISPFASTDPSQSLAGTETTTKTEVFRSRPLLPLRARLRQVDRAGAFGGPCSACGASRQAIRPGGARLDRRDGRETAQKPRPRRCR